MSEKAWEKTFTHGSKALQDRLRAAHARNPKFQEWLHKSGYGTGQSVRQASKEVKISSRVKDLQAKSLKAYGATTGTRMGGEDGGGETVRDTIAPLTRDQHSKVQAAEREAKAATKKPKAAPKPKKALSASERLAAIAAAVRKSKSKERFDVPTTDPDDMDAEDLRDVHAGLHIRGSYVEESTKINGEEKMSLAQRLARKALAEHAEKLAEQMSEEYVIHKGKHAPNIISSLSGQTLHGVTVKDVYTDKEEAQRHADIINAGRGYEPGDENNPLMRGVLYQVSPRKSMEENPVNAYDKEGKLVGRYRNMDHAKFMKPGHTYEMAEEVEQIDEISQNTINSYLRKKENKFIKDLDAARAKPSQVYDAKGKPIKGKKLVTSADKSRETKARNRISTEYEKSIEPANARTDAFDSGRGTGWQTRQMLKGVLRKYYDKGKALGDAETAEKAKFSKKMSNLKKKHMSR